MVVLVLGAGYGGICDKRLVSKWAAAATTKKLRRRKMSYNFSLYEEQGKKGFGSIHTEEVLSSRVFAYHLHYKTIGKHGG